MTQANQKIRRTAAGAGVKLWQIANRLGITDSYFSRLLRKELPADKQAEIMQIIAQLGGENDTAPPVSRHDTNGAIKGVRVYEGIGPNKGKVIYGDSDARALMYEQIGIEPINGWENIDPEFIKQFDRDMLDWWYSDAWIIYPDEESFRASYREAV